MTTPIDARRGLRIRVRLSLAFAACWRSSSCWPRWPCARKTALDGALERLLGQQSAARDTIHQITTSAEDATRKLLTLMHRERTRRIPAYADIDAAHRRLDTALQRLDQTLPVAASAEVKQLLMERLRDFRRQYDLTVDRIEADDFEAARQSLSGPGGGGAVELPRRRADPVGPDRPGRCAGGGAAAQRDGFDAPLDLHRLRGGLCARGRAGRGRHALHRAAAAAPDGGSRPHRPR